MHYKLCNVKEFFRTKNLTKIPGKMRMKIFAGLNKSELSEQ